MNRREFIGSAGAMLALTGGVSGCASVATASSPSRKIRADKLYGALLHLGNNMWSDQPHPRPKDEKRRFPFPDYLTKAEIERNKLGYSMGGKADHLRFDDGVWRRVTTHMQELGMNFVMIDVGEGFRYPSHPEIAAKDAWDVGRMEKELARLRAMGLNPIPKLNFSTTHSAWMGEMRLKTSSPEYYRFVADVIADVCAVFKPECFHIGYDEEDKAHQFGYVHEVVRDEGTVFGHSQTTFVQATVCDASGSFPTKNAAGELRRRTVTVKTGAGAATEAKSDVCYEFYARPDGGDAGHSVMVVRFVQPVGGLGQGLFRVPRPGDRILAMRFSPGGTSVGGINYLVGYLPGSDMKHVKTWSDERKKALVLRFDQTEGMKTSLCSAAASKTEDEKNLLSALTADTRFDADGAFRREAKENAFSELGFYDRHTSSMTVVDPKEKVQAFTESDPEKRGALANLQSTGDVQVSANDRIEINARNIHFGAHGWKTWRSTSDKVEDGKLEIDSISELVGRARRRVVLSVDGASALVIDHDGVAVRSTRWNVMTCFPATSSSMAVSGLRGVEVVGASVNIKGALGTRFTDAAGSSLALSAGTACLTGSFVREQSKTVLGLLGSLAGTAGSAVAFPSINAIFGTGDPATSSTFSRGGPVVSGVLDVVFALGFKEVYSESDKLTAIRFISVLRAITALIRAAPMVIQPMMTEYKWEKKLSSGLVASDVICLLSMLSSLALWMIAFIALTCKNVTKRNAAVSLKSSGLWINAPEEQNFTVRHFTGNAATAGRETKVEEFGDADSKRNNIDIESESDFDLELK